MSDLFDRATSVFRDFNTVGDDLSGAHEPTKASARALMAVMTVWAEGWISGIVNAPTGDELPGERYIVGASPTGVFVNSPNCLAILIDDVWNFADPSEGAQLYNRAYDRQHKFDGTSWGTIPSTSDALQKAANLSDVANPSAARTNLSAAASGANTDISSLDGLNKPIRPLFRTITAAGPQTLSQDDDTVYVNQTAGAAITLHLPAAPTKNCRITVKDRKGDAAINAITIQTADGKTIDGANNSFISSNGGSLTFCFLVADTQWSIL